MSVDTYLMPGIRISTLKEDPQLVVGDNKITLKGTNSSVYNYIDDDEKNDDKAFDYCGINEDSFEILTYFFRKYNNLIGGDCYGNDAGYEANQQTYALSDSYSEEECEEAFIVLFTELACQEMIDFKHFYELTDDEVIQLEEMKTKNKEQYEYWKNKVDEELFKERCGRTSFCNIQTDNNIQTDIDLPF